MAAWDSRDFGLGKYQEVGNSMTSDGDVGAKMVPTNVISRKFRLRD